MRHLADTSVWIVAFRQRDPRFFAAVEDGDVVVCPPVVLELLTGAPNPRALRAWREVLAATPRISLAPAIGDRAEEVVALLAERDGGRHRSVPAADLLIAACAERAGLPLLHADGHFAEIAAVTGQPHRRVDA